jgi:putative holliday junction resolvase
MPEPAMPQPAAPKSGTPRLATPQPPAAPESAAPPLAMPQPATPGPAALDYATPAGQSPQLVLAFDFGLRRIGVACGDTLSRAASPLTGIPNSSSRPRWDLIDSLIREWEPALLVVGLPYNANGSESAMSGSARGFADELARRYALTLHLIDERYSSLEAQSRLKGARARGLRKRRVAKADVDAAAASVILERWFTEKA